MKKINLLFIVSGLLLSLLLFYGVYAADFSNSVSATNVQFTQPSVSNPGFGYSSLISGSTMAGNDNELYDMQVFIPPLGCKPYVVRSDLLEEQNVPVFCDLMALKINPGVDINRIDRVTTSQVTNNPYIAGIGFYPARAAIRARSSMTSIPADNTLGYVVVVLKKQNSEKDMPETVNTTLSAYLDYGADNAFGIGQTEYYLPVITDDEFNNNYQDYSFFNGLGYIRAENVNDKSATISVYSSNSYSNSADNLRRAWGTTIDAGKTSSDFYLNTPTGGQRVRVTLDSVTVPQTKARIVVNGQTYEVYKNGKFYNNKCSLTNVVSTGGGSGTASINCPGKTFNLVKKFNQVSLIVRGNAAEYSIGEKIDLFNSTAPGLNYYLAYVGNTVDKTNQYVFLAKDSSNKLLDSSQVGQITSAIARRINDDKAIQKNPASLKEAGGASLIYIELGNSKKDQNFDVEFSGTKAFNKPINTSVAQQYYDQAIKSYDNVENKFGNEQNLYAGTNQTYGVDSLWKEYNLADSLLLQENAMQILSRIANSYPSSTNKAGNNALTAAQIMSQNKLLSSEGSSDYDAQSDIYVELVSVVEPSKDEASVSLTYVGAQRSVDTGNRLSQKFDVREKETFVQEDANALRVTLDSFSSDTTYFSYSCNKSFTKTISLKQGETKTLTDCDFQLQINNINLKRVAKIQITPSVAGRTRESNFTFSIGIEKRAFAMDLTPEEANKKMDDLNKLIAELKDVTNSLNKVIEGGKLACLATNAYLNLKVAFSGSSASARTEVMTREGGWNDICKGLVAESKSSTVSKCLTENAKLIESDVEAMAKLMEDYNTNVKQIEQNSIDPKTGKPLDSLALQNSVNGLASLSTTNLIDENNQVVNAIGGMNGTGGKDVTAILKNMNASLGDIGWTDSRALAINLNITNNPAFSPQFKASAQKLAYRKLAEVNTKMGDRIQRNDLSAKNKFQISFAVNEKLPKATYFNYVWGDNFKTVNQIIRIDAGDGKNNFSNGDKVAFVSSPDRSVTYLVDLVGTGSSITRGSKIYLVSGDSITGITLTKYDESKENNAAKKPENPQFIVYDQTTYNNVCKNCNTVEVFSLDPNKGQPAMLPFDDKAGWYIYTQSAVGGFGSKATYQSSGQINSMYICNVGPNGLIDNKAGDDICEMFNTYTGQSSTVFPNLDANKAKTLISNAQIAIASAQRQLTADPKAKFITINGMQLKVVPSEGSAGSKCTDFMSASDCSLMFNVCDPFVCPSSRCDFGGQYKVDNVIQSGLVGSTVLCWPNSVLAGGDVYVPVCITGINAGLEGITSILEAYRDCINESVTTNKTVGICDQIYSVYACDFWWKNVGPFATTIAKNIFSGSALFGSGSRGGGEYMFTDNAFSNAEKSWKLFSSSYASNSKLSFGGKSFADIGSEFCKGQLSATYPSLGSVLSAESPVQITASFEESPYTDATVPPTSQYKVFYHIYSGNDSGASYQVYLKDGVDYPGYISKDASVVATGYIAAGGSKTETKDYLDVSGFKQLCVRINAKDYCGFKQVSTSFALNYVKDKVVANQATSQVNSEEECVSGSSSVSSAALSMGNLQSGAQSIINPQIYNYGIVRICATVNPGTGTDLTRWTEVGNCGNANLKCWVDGKSVKNALTFKGIENQTLSELENISIANLLAQGYFNEGQGNANITAIENKYKSIMDYNRKTILTDTEKTDLAGLDAEVDTVYQKLVFGYQKVKLLYIKSIIYDGAARLTNQKSISVSPTGGNVTSTIGGVKSTTPTPLSAGTFSIDHDNIFLLIDESSSDTGLTVKIANPTTGFGTVSSGSNPIATFNNWKLDSVFKGVGISDAKINSYLTEIKNNYVFTLIGGTTGLQKISGVTIVGAGSSAGTNSASSNSTSAVAPNMGTTGYVSSKLAGWSVEDTVTACSYLDLGGIVISAAAKSVVNTYSTVATAAMNALTTAPDVVIQEGTNILSSSPYWNSADLEIKNINKMSYAFDKSTNEIIGEVTSEGKFIKIPVTSLTNEAGITYKVATSAMGSGELKLLQLPAGFKLADATTKQVLGTIDEADALVAKSMGKNLKYISKTSPYIGVLSKLSYVSLVTSAASGACNIGTLGYIIIKANTATNQMEASGQASDAQIQTLVDTFVKTTDDLESGIADFNNQYNDLVNTDPYLANQIKPYLDNLNANITLAQLKMTVLYNHHTDFEDNAERQSTSGSAFSDREYLILQTDVRTMRSLLVNIKNNTDALSSILSS